MACFSICKLISCQLGVDFYTPSPTLNSPSTLCMPVTSTKMCFFVCRVRQTFTNG